MLLSPEGVVPLSEEGVLLPAEKLSEAVVWLFSEIVGDSELCVPEVPLEQPASSNAEKASAASLYVFFILRSSSL